MTRQAWASVVVGGWLLSLPLVTATRVRVWQSDRVLWADALVKAPQKLRVVLNDGRQHELVGDVVYAEAAYRRVIGMALFQAHGSRYLRQFSEAAAETNLAHLLMKQGKLASAMVVLDMILTEWPMFPYAHYNKGAIFWAVGACEDARVEYDFAVRVEPSLPLPTTPCVPSATP